MRISFGHLLLLLTNLIFSVTTASAQNHTYSDELVTDLSCEKINTETVLQAIDSQKAFTSFRHIPLKNWAFSVGLYEIANCWSLSRSQRLMFYLGRADLPQTQTSLKQSLSMIRKYTPAGVYNHTHMVPWSSDWFEVLAQGYQETVNNKNYVRNFKNDIQTYQNKRFHDLDNTAYLNGERERSAKENMKTFATLKSNVDSKKLSLIILRPARRSQHVVVPKYSITRPTGEIDFFVYDSNLPQKDVTVTYDPKNSHFYAPEIVSYFNLPRPNDPVGVFLVDDQERDPILATLVKYYTQTCEALNWAKN